MDDAIQQSTGIPKGTLWIYGILTYLALLISGARYLWIGPIVGMAAWAYSIVVLLTYFLVFALALFLPLWGLMRLLDLRILDRLGGRYPLLRKAAICTSMVLVAAALQLLIHIDVLVYRLYGFHFNGFVWSLVTTRGGIESMGASQSTYLTFVVHILFFIAVQVALLIVALRSHPIRRFSQRWTTRRVGVVVSLLFAAGAVSERVAYAVSDAFNYAPVLSAAGAFPVYIPFTAHKLAKRMGIRRSKTPILKVDPDRLVTHYPLAPITREPNPQNLNVVWLACESLRADMLDPEIMPRSYAFAQNAVWFKHHYSGGNGTRMGMFSMFYGLYGSYWFPFLAEHRSPVLLDMLQDAGYQMLAVTSASFSSPELNRTVFSGLPSTCMSQDNEGPGWKRDRVNITRILKWWDRRNAAKPFFTFMFFESPHAHYYFPDECIIRKDYLKDFNYLAVDLHRDIGRIKNRYLNACRHLDTQIARVLDALEKHHLLDSTIVLITGDHGEAFMEHGRWGHGSDFSDEQTRVPLILWVPGQRPRQITRMTSHLDLPATLMTQLGVRNPPEDYSLGYDLLGDRSRSYAVIASWTNVVYLDQEYKAVFPMRSRGWSPPMVYAGNYTQAPQANLFFETHKKVLVQLMHEMKKFKR